MRFDGIENLNDIFAAQLHNEWCNPRFRRRYYPFDQALAYMAIMMSR